ncbi:MAG: penicillin-binding protein [Firmicutes bacterium]|nr:penicillin-binding protein [[Eubacterium] siraeum]MCM1488773.1 penicillin-binding protein [Bacillota bacterium]
MNKDKKVKYVKIDEDYERENPRPTAAGRKKAKKSPKITVATVIGKTVGVIGTTIAAMILVIIIALCITVTGLALYVTQFAESDFDVNLDDAELSSSTFIYAYDADGSEIQLKQLSTDENRVLIKLDDLPQHVIDAFVSVEDNRFFEHEGVDWKRTVALMVKSVFSDNSQGGSTVTQQLVRDVTGDKEVSYGRKLREIFRALEMEKKYSKKDILESYLNRIPLGGTTYGIASASIRYFDKSPDQLTIAEAALLAGIVRSPGRNPYADAEWSRDREIYGLDCMLKYGYITSREYEQALNEKIRFKLPIKGDYFGYVDERYNEYYGVQDENSDDSDLYYENSTWEELGVSTDNSYTPYKWNGDYEVSQNWYVDAAIEQIIADLAELKGVTTDAARTLFYKGGFKAYLNMDMEMQDKLEEMFADPLTCLQWYDEEVVIDLPETAENEIDIRKRDLIQGSFVITNYSGSVLALVGGLGEKEGNGCFNRATQDPQIIGSTIKPLAVYSPAIENNIVTYSTLAKDQSGKIPAEALGTEATSGYDPEDNTVRWPHNYQEEGFGSEQYVPIWYAVQKSMNTIAVNTLSKVGLQTAFTQLSDKLHFTLDPVNDMAYSPLALGSITEGVTLTQLAAAYSMIGNGGLYYHPYLYSKVVDSEGRIVLSQNVMGERVISSDTAYIVNRMMRQVVIDSTGSGRHAQLENIEVVGKTGTANDESTLSFVGLTPNYVACYRISRDNHKPIYKNSGWQTVPLVWGNIMKEITAGEPNQSFTKDSNVKELNYCTETGLIAGSKCEDTRVGYYRTSNIPSVCDGDHETYRAERDENDEIPFYG